MQLLCRLVVVRPDLHRLYIFSYANNGAARLLGDLPQNVPRKPSSGDWPRLGKGGYLWALSRSRTTIIVNFSRSGSQSPPPICIISLFPHGRRTTAIAPWPHHPGIPHLSRQLPPSFLPLPTTTRHRGPAMASPPVRLPASDLIRN